MAAVTREPAAAGRPSAAELWSPAMEGVRGWLGLTVALTHVFLAIGWTPASETLHAFRASAFWSIELLFLIGGFVAFLPVVALGRFRSRRVYAVRRAARIVPLYYLTIALAVALGGLLRPVTTTEFPHDATAVLAHVAFVHHLVYPFESGFGVQGIIWTMTVVVTFYVLFAAIARLWLRQPIAWLLAGVALAVVWRETTRTQPDLYLQFPLFAADFAIGMTGAYAYIRLRRAGRLRPRAALTAACLGALALFVAGLYLSGLPIARGEGNPWGEASWLAIGVPAVFTAFLVTLSGAPAWLRAMAGPSPIRWLGSISYAFFLLHFLVIWMVLRFVDIPRDGSLSSTIALAALVIPITATLAWAGTRWIEDPVRERAKRWSARADAPATAAGVGAPAPVLAADRAPAG